MTARFCAMPRLPALAAVTAKLPPLIEFGQGFRDMSPAIETFETLLISGQLVHNGNPVLTSCAANAVIVEDDAGNRKLSKRLATGRIDPILAAVMAVGRAAMAEEASGYYAGGGEMVVF